MKMLVITITITCLLVFTCNNTEASQDYYNLLGVRRDATVKEIRKAFKSLAVKLHPDKNKNDKDADANFIKLARAYEVLKDPNLRKHYDVHGDTDSDGRQKQQYHSYNYYKNQFGIYDDDLLIVTLSSSDYEINVLDKNQAWFINFYSPHCHHCHELAPVWRKLASELEGVVRVAAVNCEDDYNLCYRLSIEAYPTLLYYEKEANLYEGETYVGDRSVQAMTDFVLSKLKVDIKEITTENWRQLNRKLWLLFLCPEDNFSCPESEVRIKLAASLEGLMSVGMVKDSELCKELSGLENNDVPIVFWQIDENKERSEGSDGIIKRIEGSDTKEILETVLNLLPDPETLDEDKFKEIRSNLRENSGKPWLLCFYLGAATDLNLQLKRLPPLIPDINIGLIHCGKSSVLCSSLHVVRYPTWGVLKVGGAFEIHHGREVLHEISSFARDSVRTTNLHALSPADFRNVMREGYPWFIDWYAPWCPPCIKLLPEIRKASREFEPGQVQFGTIDCTSHRDLCLKEGINSYPTVILYNGTQKNRYHNVMSASHIAEFVNDMINPLVINLDGNSFAQLLRKPTDQMWLVDFYAPWCGPCQKLSIEWRKLAKQVSQLTEIKVAQVDCVANYDLCDAQRITAYPTIRLYPLGGKGLSTVALYNGNRDSTALKRWLLSFLPSSVVSLDRDEFEAQILTKNFVLPWLVDFYTSWCGHCVHFEPEFRMAAQKLEGRVRSGKIDCEAERHFCGSLGITGYPTVRLYLSPKEFYKIDSRESSQVIRKVKELIEESENKYRSLDRDEL